jgi:hypothetical protein
VVGLNVHSAAQVEDPIDRRVDAGGRPVYAMARLADDWRAGRTTSTGDGLDDLRLSADCP